MGRFWKIQRGGGGGHMKNPFRGGGGYGYFLEPHNVPWQFVTQDIATTCHLHFTNTYVLASMCLFVRYPKKVCVTTYT